MQHAIGQTTGIAAGDVEGIVFRVDGIALPCATQLTVAVGTLHGGKNDRGFIIYRFSTIIYARCAAARHPFDVVGQHLCHLLYQRGIVLLINDGCLRQVDGLNDMKTGDKHQ